jgi:hypothetical protein
MSKQTRNNKRPLSKEDESNLDTNSNRINKKIKLSNNIGLNSFSTAADSLTNLNTNFEESTGQSKSSKSSSGSTGSVLSLEDASLVAVDFKCRLIEEKVCTLIIVKGCCALFVAYVLNTLYLIKF